MYDIDTTNMRKRTRSADIATYNDTIWNGYTQKVGSDTITTWNYDTLHQPTSGFYATMYDVPTAGFKKLSAAGVVINSPMQQESYSFSYKYGSASEDGISYDNVRIWTAPGCQFAPTMPDFALDYPTSLLDTAITAAFANVTSAATNPVLWAGEAREALRMFLSMGDALQLLLRTTAEHRKAYLKGKLSVKEAQSMTLALLYGILPLEEQIKQYSKLLDTKKAQRYTSRGRKVFSKSRPINYSIDRQTHYCKVTGQEQMTATVRSGVLYTVNSDVPGIMPYIDAHQVVSAAHALMRLSFVLDWFINVGNTLAAWVPASNTTVLAAWVKVDVLWTMQVNNTLYADPANRYRKSCTVSGNSSGTKSKTLSKRVPIPEYQRYQFPSINIQLNLNKLFALILLFAKAKEGRA